MVGVARAEKRSEYPPRSFVRMTLGNGSSKKKRPRENVVSEPGLNAIQPLLYLNAYTIRSEVASCRR